jgi:hypothetical protein
MQTNASTDNRTLNSFAASFTVAMILLAGFIVAATGLTITSATLAVMGFLTLLAGLGLYGLLLV